jgi:hypothetical protein
MKGGQAGALTLAGSDLVESLTIDALELGQFRRGHDGREEVWNVCSNMKNEEFMLKCFAPCLLAIVVLIDLLRASSGWLVGEAGELPELSQPPPWHNTTGRRKAV